jgi:hypothetical protein
VKFASGTESLLYQMHWKCLQRCITPLNSATTNTTLYYQQAIHQRQPFAVVQITASCV